MIVDAAKQTNKKITREIEGFWTKGQTEGHPSSLYQDST